MNNTRPSSQAATKAAAELLQQNTGSTAPVYLPPAMPSIDAGRANFFKTHPPQRRQLSHRMLNTFDNEKLHYEFTTEGEVQLKDYTAITRKTTDFHLQRARPLISFTFRGYEMILLDPRSDYLQKEYARLKKSLPDSKEPIEILRAVHQFIRQEFSVSNSDLPNAEKNIKQVAKTHGSPLPSDPNIFVVHLEEFLKRKIAICRHLALKAAFDIDSLKQEGILPVCLRVYHHLDTVPTGNHVWVMCHDPLTDNLFVVDPAYQENVHCIRRRPYPDLYKERFGEKILDQCNQEYNLQEHNLGSYKDFSSDDKKTFAANLLEHKSLRCELALHQQYARGAGSQLRKDLDTAPYCTSPNHQFVMQTLEKIEKTSATMRTSTFTTLSGLEEKKHFILALLTQVEAKSDVQSVLQHQGTTDLLCLRGQMILGFEIASKLYHQVSSLDTLRIQINEQLAVLEPLTKRLDWIKYIILAESTADNSATGCCFFSKPWHEVKTEHGVRMRIPTRIYPLYQLAFAVDTGNTNLAGLTKALTDIRTAARTAQTQHRNDNLFLALSDEDPEKKYGELTKSTTDALLSYVR